MAIAIGWVHARGIDILTKKENSIVVYPRPIFADDVQVTVMTSAKEESVKDRYPTPGEAFYYDLGRKDERKFQQDCITRLKERIEELENQLVSYYPDPWRRIVDGHSCTLIELLRAENQNWQKANQELEQEVERLKFFHRKFQEPEEEK